MKNSTSKKVSLKGLIWNEYDDCIKCFAAIIAFFAFSALTDLLLREKLLIFLSDDVGEGMIKEIAIFLMSCLVTALIACAIALLVVLFVKGIAAFLASKKTYEAINNLPCSKEEIAKMNIDTPRDFIITVAKNYRKKVGPYIFERGAFQIPDKCLIEMIENMGVIYGSSFSKDALKEKLFVLSHYIEFGKDLYCLNKMIGGEKLPAIGMDGEFEPPKFENI